MTTLARQVTAMAMDFTVAAEGGVDPTTADAVMGHVHADLAWVDAVFSPYREDSWVTRLSRGQAATADAPPAVAEVLDLCEQYRDVTDGAFDARSPDGGVDPTGIVKTWAMARSWWRLRLMGATGLLFGCAGDAMVDGHGPADGAWRIGIADPRVAAGPGAPVVETAVLGAGPTAIATTGDAHRPGHVWDPRTGAAAAHFAQVSVVGEDLIECDAWATAIMAGGQRTLGLADGRGMAAIALSVRDGQLHARRTQAWPAAS